MLKTLVTFFSGALGSGARRLADLDPKRRTRQLMVS